MRPVKAGLAGWPVFYGARAANRDRPAASLCVAAPPKFLSPVSWHLVSCGVD